MMNEEIEMYIHKNNCLINKLKEREATIETLELKLNS